MTASASDNRPPSAENWPWLRSRASESALSIAPGPIVLKSLHYIFGDVLSVGKRKLLESVTSRSAQRRSGRVSFRAARRSACSPFGRSDSAEAKGSALHACPEPRRGGQEDVADGHVMKEPQRRGRRRGRQHFRGLLVVDCLSVRSSCADAARPELHRRCPSRRIRPEVQRGHAGLTFRRSGHATTLTHDARG